jgi:hypothetical protein
MKERPILFSGPMVIAILAGQKTVTRRVVKFGKQTPLTSFVSRDGVLRYTWCDKPGVGLAMDEKDLLKRCTYGVPGGRLWVRENYSRCACDACLAAWPKRPANDHGVTYIADYQGPSGIVVRPSIFMPRWASRITLNVVSVRVERLQEITEGDAIREGIVFSTEYDPTTAYRNLWNSINGPGSWESNPWVWRIEFEVVK